MTFIGDEVGQSEPNGKRLSVNVASCHQRMSGRHDKISDRGVALVHDNP